MNQFEAARGGDLEWFSNNEFDINAQDSNGDTVLILASWIGHTEIALLLIEKGANLDLQDNRGDPALLRASWKGHTEIALSLIEKGANFDLQNTWGNTTLICASWYGRKEIAFALIEKGASLDLQNAWGNTALIRASWKGSIFSEIGSPSLLEREEIAVAIESWQRTPRSLKYVLQMCLKGCVTDTSNMPNLLLQRNSIEKEINIDQEF